MSDTLTRTTLVVPEADGSDPVDVAGDLRIIGQWLEDNGLIWEGQGLLASRPAAGTQGRVYRATDVSGVLYYDNGATWDTIGASAPADPAAATPGLRTLGSGSTQAAAGNHTHGSDDALLAVMGAR